MTIKRKYFIFIAILTLGCLEVCEPVQDNSMVEFFTNSILNFKEFMLEWVSSTHFLICLLFHMPLSYHKFSKNSKSCLGARPRFYRLFMKGKFDVYLPSPFDFFFNSSYCSQLFAMLPVATD